MLEKRNYQLYSVMIWSKKKLTGFGLVKLKVITEPSAALIKYLTECKLLLRYIFGQLLPRIFAVVVIFLLILMLSGS